MDQDELLEHGEPRWECVRTFLAVARRKSFRAAHLGDGVPVTTSRRHIEELEKTLNVVLFLRNPSGLELTEDGQRVFDAAEKMERAARILHRTAESVGDRIAGHVRICVTEGLGTVWLMPHAVDLQLSHPDLALHIDNQMQPQDLTSSQADLSIQFDPATAPELRTVKLGRIHVMPFAATAYIEAHGRPESLYALRRHKLVIQQGPQMHARKYWQQFASYLLRRNTAVTTNTSVAHFYAVRFGAGIGLLPTYAALLSDRILPIDVGPRIHRDIYLVFHPDIRRIPRVAFTIDWVKQIFDSDTYPWFSDRFIHPAELAQRVGDPKSLEQLLRFAT